MIEQAGRVVVVQDGYAVVESDRASACGGCAGQAGCATSALAGVFSARPVRLRAVNPIHARPGDRVVLGIPAAGLLRGSLAVYLLPLAGLFAGALAGDGAGRLLSDAGGDLYALAGAVCGFAAGLWRLRAFSRAVANHGVYQPVILRQDHPFAAREVPVRDGAFTNTIQK